MDYFTAIRTRRDLARTLFNKLTKEEMDSKTELPFDKRVRLWKVQKALRDNQKLLDEKYGMID
jgi:hypothetical protein